MSPTIQKSVLQLWDQVSSLEAEAEALVQDSRSIFEVPSGLDQSPLPTYYSFSHFRLAETMCHFWKLVMLSAQIMKTCGLENHIRTENSNQPQITAAIRICRTVEYAMQMKPLGAWYIPLVLPLATFTLSGFENLQIYATWAYRDITGCGMVFGLDMDANGKNLLPTTEGVVFTLCSQWRGIISR